jgi:hypothetical protein
MPLYVAGCNNFLEFYAFKTGKQSYIKRNKRKNKRWNYFSTTMPEKAV